MVRQSIDSCSDRAEGIRIGGGKSRFVEGLGDAVADRVRNRTGVQMCWLFKTRCRTIHTNGYNPDAMEVISHASTQGGPDDPVTCCFARADVSDQ